MKRKTLKGIALYNDLTRYCIDLVKVESEALENQDPIHCVNIRGSEWGGPLVGCRLKFSHFVGSRLKFSIFVGSRLKFSIFVGCR